MDDGAAERRAMAAILTELGVAVELAENGAEALRAVSAKQFDLVFVDLMMPVLDGIDLLRILRTRGEGARIVVMSATGDMKLVVSAVKLGAVDYLVKPFDAGQVTAALGRIYGAAPSPPVAGTPAESAGTADTAGPVGPGARMGSTAP